jgi:hypothetical protein
MLETIFRGPHNRLETMMKKVVIKVKDINGKILSGKAPDDVVLGEMVTLFVTDENKKSDSITGKVIEITKEI